MEDVSEILTNLSFLSLIDHFRINGVNGEAIRMIESAEEIADIGIPKLVAKGFYRHVVEWQKTGTVPSELLHRRNGTTPTSNNFKVVGM